MRGPNEQERVCDDRRKQRISEEFVGVIETSLERTRHCGREPEPKDEVQMTEVLCLDFSHRSYSCPSYVVESIAFLN